MKLHACDKCPMKSYAERKPRSIIARIWRWHTRWCPGWKAYQKTLSEPLQKGSSDPPLV